MTLNWWLWTSDLIILAGGYVLGRMHGHRLYRQKLNDLTYRVDLIYRVQDFADKLSDAVEDINHHVKEEIDHATHTRH